MINNDFYQKQREFVTKKYLDYCDYQGYDKQQSESMISLFWQKVDYFPTYELECEKTRAKMRGLGVVYNPDSGKHPDLDYASRFTGISADYIWNLMGIFAYTAYEK